MGREINLLPPTRRLLLRQQLLVAAMTRFVQRCVWALLALSTGGLVLLMALYLLVLVTVPDEREKLRDAEEQYGKLRQRVQQREVALREMRVAAEGRLEWVGLVDEVLQLLPAGVFLDKVGGQTEERQLSLFGRASTRAMIITLGEQLKDLPWVKEVTAPNSNLLQRENPSFQFDLRLKAMVEKEGSP